MKAFVLAVVVAISGLVGCNAKPLKEVNLLQECMNAPVIYKSGAYSVNATEELGCVWFADKEGNNLLINVSSETKTDLLTTIEPMHENDEYYTAKKISANAIKTILVVDDIEE